MTTALNLYSLAGLYFVEWMWQRKSKGSNAPAQWACGVIGVFPFLQILLMLALLFQSRDPVKLPWAWTIAPSIFLMGEAFLFACHLIHQEESRGVAWRNDILALGLGMTILSEPVLWWAMPEFTMSSWIVRLVIQVAYALFITASMGLLFFRYEGIPLIKTIVVWFKKNGIGVFFSSGYTLAMGIMAIVYGVQQEDGSSYYSVASFWFLMVALRLASFFWEKTLKKKHPDDPERVKGLENNIALFVSIALLSLGRGEAACLQSFGQMRKENSGMNWLVINSIAFAAFRLVRVLQLLLSPKRKRSMYYSVHGTLDVVTLCFVAFSLVEIFLKRWESDWANLVVLLVFIATEGFLIFIEAYLLAKAIQGKKAETKRLASLGERK